MSSRLTLIRTPGLTAEQPVMNKYLEANANVSPYPVDFLEQAYGEVHLTKRVMEETLVNSKEWIFMPVGSEIGFFANIEGSLAKFNVSNWINVISGKDAANVPLKECAIVYAELVDEIDQNGKKLHAFNIIDAIKLGDDKNEDIRHLQYHERFDRITKYARFFEKKNQFLDDDDAIVVRAKPYNQLKYSELLKVLGDLKLDRRIMDDEAKAALCLCPIDTEKSTDRFFHSSGLLFIKAFPEQVETADFRFSVQNRIFWKWTEDVDLTLPTNLLEELSKDNAMEVDAEDGDNVPNATDILRCFMHAD